MVLRLRADFTHTDAVDTVCNQIDQICQVETFRRVEKGNVAHRIARQRITLRGKCRSISRSLVGEREKSILTDKQRSAPAHHNSPLLSGHF